MRAPLLWRFCRIALTSCLREPRSYRDVTFMRNIEIFVLSAASETQSYGRGRQKEYTYIHTNVCIMRVHIHRMNFHTIILTSKRRIILRFPFFFKAPLHEAPTAAIPSWVPSPSMTGSSIFFDCPISSTCQPPSCKNFLPSLFPKTAT